VCARLDVATSADSEIRGDGEAFEVIRRA
jgi:hypothetical protein